jgi:hypothetical protein
MAQAAEKEVNPRAPLMRKIRIELSENDEIPPTGQFFSVNDHSYVLRPGEEADVPEELVNVLEAAVVTIPIMQGEKIVGYKNKLRFPYRVIARDIN